GGRGRGGDRISRRRQALRPRHRPQDRAGPGETRPAGGGGRGGGRRRTAGRRPPGGRRRRPAGLGHGGGGPGAHRRLRARRRLRPLRHARHRRDPGRGRRRRRLPAGAARRRRRRGPHRRPRPRGAARAGAGRTARRPGGAGRDPARPLGPRRRRRAHPVDRPQPADRLGRRAGGRRRPRRARRMTLRSLFEPNGVIVVGASSHPAKFGFVALHNVLAQGFPGRVFAVNRDGGEILGLPTATDIGDLPSGEADLAVVCTPATANPGVLQACAAKGVKAAYVVSGGYRETGAEGRRAEEELVALADKLGMVLAGPNGQGLISTPARLCAQIVGPYPVAGTISVASQSGNATSSFMNYANHSGVGIARAVSAGNAAAVTVADYLEWFGADAATGVAFAYLEHSADGRATFEKIRSVTSVKPVVMVKGGVSRAGQQAAASHTGALAGEQRIFTGAMRQAGVCLVPTVEEAFDAAATFATQPRPKGPNTVVVTTAGGWGVMTADALASSSLRLMPLPDDLRAAI